MKTTNDSIAPLTRSQYGIYAECVSHENEVFYNLPFLGARTKSRDDSHRQPVHLTSAVPPRIPLVEHLLGLRGPDAGGHCGVWVF